MMKIVLVIASIMIIDTIHATLSPEDKRAATRRVIRERVKSGGSRLKTVGSKSLLNLFANGLAESCDPEFVEEQDGAYYMEDGASQEQAAINAPGKMTEFPDDAVRISCDAYDCPNIGGFFACAFV